MAPVFKLTARAAVFAIALAASAAHATHFPGSSASVDYDGALSSGVAATGTIGWSTPIDGYDWYCFTAPSTASIGFAATRTSGDILLNLQIFSGATNSGSTAATLGGFVSGTSNSTTADISLNFAPPAAGVYTIAVATFNGEAQGNYSLVMTGGAPAVCAGAPPAAPALPVPVASNATLAWLAALLSLAGVIALQRRKRS